MSFQPPLWVDVIADDRETASEGAAKVPRFVPAPAPFGSRAWRELHGRSAKEAPESTLRSATDTGPPSPRRTGGRFLLSPDAQRAFPISGTDLFGGSESTGGHLGPLLRPADAKRSHSEEDAAPMRDAAHAMARAVLKRVRLSPSAATGFVGLEESSFVATFSRELAPFFSQLLPRAELHSAIAEATRSSQLGGYQLSSSSKGSGGDNPNPVLAFIAQGTGPAATRAASGSLFAAMALGAFLQGAAPHVCERCMAAARAAVDGATAVEKSPELVHALLLMALVDDCRGNIEGFIAYTFRAVKTCEALPLAERRALEPLFEWFDQVIRFKPQVSADWEPSDAPDLVGSFVTGLCEPLAVYLRRPSVYMFIVTLEKLYIECVRVKLEEPWRPNAFTRQLVPLRQALNALLQLAAAEPERVGALGEICLLVWQAIVELHFGDAVSGAALCIRALQAVERAPGSMRLSSWVHRGEVAAYVLHHLGYKDEYERFRAVVNHHNANGLILPPYDDVELERDFCPHVSCREAMRLAWVLPPEEPLQQKPAAVAAAVEPDAAAETVVLLESGDDEHGRACSFEAESEVYVEGSGAFGDLGVNEGDLLGFGDSLSDLGTLEDVGDLGGSLDLVAVFEASAYSGEGGVPH